MQVIEFQINTYADEFQVFSINNREYPSERLYIAHAQNVFDFRVSKSRKACNFFFLQWNSNTANEKL